jgi:hypothetical protein
MAGFIPGPDGAPSSTIHRHALAALFSLHAAACVTRTADRPIIIRSCSPAALKALQRGSSSDPVLQDITLLFTAACLDLRMDSPLLLLTASTTHPDPPSREALASALSDSATPRLRAIVTSLARQAGQRLTIDHFATRGNTQCSRYCSAHPEAAAEALDAFSQPCWARSLCSICNLTRPEFVLLYPPFPLIAATIRRAQEDQAHGILVVPFATTASWWYTATLASLTRPSRLLHALRVPCSPDYVERQSNPPGHRLALMHFDFWRGSEPRPRPCLHGHFPRPHPAAQTDPVDLAHIEASIAALHPHTATPLGP